MLIIEELFLILLTNELRLGNEITRGYYRIISYVILYVRAETTSKMLQEGEYRMKYPMK